MVWVLLKGVSKQTIICEYVFIFWQLIQIGIFSVHYCMQLQFNAFLTLFFRFAIFFMSTLNKEKMVFQPNFEHGTIFQIFSYFIYVMSWSL